MLSDVGNKFVKQTSHVVRLGFLVFDVNQELDRPALHDHTTQVLQVSTDLKVLDLL